MKLLITSTHSFSFLFTTSRTKLIPVCKQSIINLTTLTIFNKTLPTASSSPINKPSNPNLSYWMKSTNT